MASTTSSEAHGTSPTEAIPAVNEVAPQSPSPSAQDEGDSPASGSSTESDEPSTATSKKAQNRLSRPQLGNRKSSGTLIVPRDSPNVEIRDEEYDEGDARTMSPRRTSEEIEKLGREAREALIEQAKTLQASLMEICDRVEVVKMEHEKLEGENKFLQNYIGELMQTTKITSTGAPKNKGKQRGVR